MGKLSLIDQISQYFNLSEAETTSLILSSPYRYKIYKIPKRTQGKFRTIAQPAREVKALQYWMIDNILKDFPTHQTATAYTPMSSIKKNARIHSHNQYLLKLDFTDFFPSITPKDLYEYLKRMEINSLSDQDFQFAKNILFWKPKGRQELELSIGAPTSPLVSNLVMFEFDMKVADLCKDLNVAYSRYADDLTFSTNVPYALKSVYSKVAAMCIGWKHPKLAINQDKTVWSSKRHRRRITGLIITNEGRISLGRERKRLIRAQIHRFTLGALNIKEVMRLKGLLSFVHDVEPSFEQRMKKKYGPNTIEQIFRTTG